MLGPFDFVVWLAGFLAEVFVLAWAVHDHSLRRHRSLLVYVAALAADEILSFVILRRYGFTSNEYIYYYYYSDAVLTLLMFLAIMGLCALVFREQERSGRLRALTLMILATVALYAAAITVVKHQVLATHFAGEFCGGLYFTGMVMTYLVWVLLLSRRDPRLRLVLLVSAFGIYFGGQSAASALQSLFPALTALHYLSPMMGACLPISLAYTFSWVSEEARIPLEQLAGVW